MIRENRHLKGIKITDRDDKPQLPIHVVLKLPIHVVLEASAQGSKLRQNHEWAIADDKDGLVYHESRKRI